MDVIILSDIDIVNKALYTYCETNELEKIKEIFLELSEDKKNKDKINYLKIHKIICQKGYNDLLLYILNIKEELLLEKRDYQNLLLLLCENGNLEMLKILIKYLRKYIRLYELNLDYCLCVTCKIGRLDIIKYLFLWNKRIDISVNYEYPFRIACFNGYLDIARYLYKRKPTININFNNYIIFIKVCEKKYNEIVKQILEWRPNLLLYCKRITPEIKEYLLNELNIEIPIPWTENIKHGDIECLICSEEHETHLMTPCNHKFCKNCILEWLSIKLECPYCRNKLV